MSVINQMLRELDARGNASSEAPVAIAAPAASRSPNKLAAMGVLLALVVGLGYWVQNEPAQRQIPTLAMPDTPQKLAYAPPADSPTPSVVPPAAKLESSGTQQAAAIPLIQMATSLTVVPSQPATQMGGAAPLSDRPPSDESKKTRVIKELADLSPEAEAQQLFEQAQVLHRGGHTEAALGKYRQALARYPGMRLAQLQLAGLLQETGQIDKALQVLTVAYEQQADDALAIAAGRMLADQGQREDALSWLKRGQASMRPADFALMGALLSQLRRYEDAVSAYQRALVADPNRGGWLLGLGLALEALGRADEARVVYQKALERGDFKPEVLDFLQKKTA